MIIISRSSLPVDALPALEPMREDALLAARWIPKAEHDGQVSSSVAAAAEGAYVACVDDEERLLVGHSQVLLFRLWNVSCTLVQHAMIFPLVTSGTNASAAARSERAMCTLCHAEAPPYRC